MHRWNRGLSGLVAATAAALLVVVAVASIRVLRVTHPTRRPHPVVDPRMLGTAAEEVAFESADGIVLAGWYLPAARRDSPILMAHNYGEDKSSLLNLARLLQRDGFPVLLFDFRGHGQSQGSRSTLGLEEKRDILGALDELGRRGTGPPTRVGIYGVGMGAHATVLAAADRPVLRVLVLDGLYPDASYRLSGAVYGAWAPALRSFSFLPSGIFSLMRGSRAGDQRAAALLGRLERREILLLAPQGDPALTAEMLRMYETIPHGPELEGNLEILGATQGEGLYGARLDLHHRRVAEFFGARLTHRAQSRRAG